MSDADRTNVAMLGLGRMGSALARAFMAAGHSTAVWNRSPEKAAPLGEEGATVHEEAAGAIEKADLVCVCVSDYAAAYVILEPLVGELGDRTVVNLTSGTPEQAREMASWCAERELNYLDGAMVAPVTIVGQAFAVSLYSGSEAAFGATAGALEALGNVSYVGEDAGLALLFDLGLLGMMWSTMLSYLQAAALARSAGIDAATFTPHAAAFLHGMPNTVERFAEMVDSGSFPGTVASLDTHAAGIGHLVEASRAAGVATDLPDVLGDLVARTIEGGHNQEGIARAILTLESAKG